MNPVLVTCIIYSNFLLSVNRCEDTSLKGVIIHLRCSFAGQWKQHLRFVCRLPSL
jgi:hypothetical protein